VTHNRPASTMHDAAMAMACGGGKEQLDDSLEDDAPVEALGAPESARVHEHHLH
jgi:anaerobic magnesium-protoporphyrin IX monomethyl ester cyclase